MKRLISKFQSDFDKMMVKHELKEPKISSTLFNAKGLKSKLVTAKEELSDFFFLLN